MKINTKDLRKNKLVHARGMDTVMYTFRIPQEILDDVKTLAKKSFLPASAVIRHALINYIESSKE